MYLDKDLVLPPMAAAGLEETFLVVASTDMERVQIMMTRIREQLGEIPELNTHVQLDTRPILTCAGSAGSGTSNRMYAGTSPTMAEQDSWSGEHCYRNGIESRSAPERAQAQLCTELNRDINPR